MKAVFLAAATLIASGSAHAQMAGAPAAVSTQPGAWGPNGWQAGASAPMAAPAMAPAPYSAASAPIVGPAPMAHVAYPRLDRGRHVPKVYREPGYAVGDWQSWGFGQPITGTHWVRYYDDALLIDAGGTVVDARYGVNWDAPRRPHYAYGYGYPAGYAGGAYPAPTCVNPGVTVTHPAPNTTVTTHTVGGPCGAPVPYPARYPGYAGGAYQGGFYTVVPGTVTTTTVTSFTQVSGYASRRAVRHRTIRSKLVRRPCNCGS